MLDLPTSGHSGSPDVAISGLSAHMPLLSVNYVSIAISEIRHYAILSITSDRDYFIILILGIQ